VFVYGNQKCEKSGLSKNLDGTTEVKIRFPKVHTHKHDQYMCTHFKVPNSQIDSYILSFTPFAKASKAHHMILYGCSGADIKPKIWECGMGSVCNGSSKTLYAWARNAASLELPKDVGVRIGQAAKVSNLVLQIHYAHAMAPGAYDCSGLSVKVTEKPQTKYAGIFLLGSSTIVVPPHKYAVAPISCIDHIPSTLHVFAFRTHAHELGLVNTAYRIRNGKTVMIGKGNPLWPEAFFTRVGGSIDLKPGDELIARCDYRSHRDRTTFVGSTGNDEMCNFYMMFYTDNKKIASTSISCWNDNLKAKFPSTASQMTPYPGYGGITSTLAILQGRAVKPKIPGSHHTEDFAPEPELYRFEDSDLQDISLDDQSDLVNDFYD